MTIQCDTREHKFELARVQRQLTRLGAATFVKKLDVGDYMNVDNPYRSVDRKKDLLEVCGNVTQQHERFQRELKRAQAAGIELIILVEHGDDIKTLGDVYFWDNPRLAKSPRATTGKQLYKSMLTMQERYGVRFVFCNKKETGKMIMELLSNGD